jgi:hypothetical protein
MKREHKDKIVEQARKWIDNSPHRDTAHRSCLVTAAILCEVVKLTTRTRALVQAGSCQWPRIPKDQDDGKVDTHFAYMWEWNDDTISRVTTAIEDAKAHRNVTLPEVHCWVALPDRGEIIDITTRYWPKQAMDLQGLDWPGVKPPDYFWGTFEQMPEDVRYVADEKACYFALGILSTGAVFKL